MDVLFAPATVYTKCSCKTCSLAAHAMIVVIESKNVWTKFDNVHAKLIEYGHYVCALVNPYFKLWTGVGWYSILGPFSQGYHTLYYTTAPGPPPTPTASSVSVTNITIQWDPIPCQDRNQELDNNFHYRITYRPMSDPSAGGGGLVSQNSREFMARGLPPRTSYIFQVQVFNVFNDVQGSLANLTVSTSEPQGELLSQWRISIKWVPWWYDFFNTTLRPWFSPGWSALS